MIVGFTYLSLCLIFQDKNTFAQVLIEAIYQCRLLLIYTILFSVVFQTFQNVLVAGLFFVVGKRSKTIVC